MSVKAAQWVTKWPASPYAWDQRLGSLTTRPNWTKDEMEKAGENVLRLEAAKPASWSYAPMELRVAQEWVRHGIRLKDCVRIGEESLDQISLGPEVASDLTTTAAANAIHTATGEYGFDTAVWDGMSVVVEGSAQLSDIDKARGMLTRMRKWLDENKAKKDNPGSGYMHFQARYLFNAGEVAEAEGHKLEAVALYVRAIAGGWRVGDAEKHARALWDQQGGTKAGWDFSTQRLPIPVPAAAQPQVKASVTTVNDFTAWRKASQPLTEMNLRDTSGKTWTLADF